MDEIREFGRITNEKYGCVISGHVPVSFFGVEFDGKTTWISLAISCSFLTTNSGESCKDGGSLSNTFEDDSLAKFRNVMSALEVTVSTSTLSVDNSLGDSFSVEVGQFINDVEIL